MFPRLTTTRLEIFPLSTGQLRLYLENPTQLAAELGFPVSMAILDQNVQRAIRIKLLRMEDQPPENHIWFTYWLISIKEQPFGAGLAGFKGCPNQNGWVEIGYGIDPVFWNKGYMSEAANALVDWALAQPACSKVTATETKNPASARVLQKIGFTKISEDEHGTNWHKPA